MKMETLDITDMTIMRDAGTKIRSSASGIDDTKNRGDSMKWYQPMIFGGHGCIKTQRATATKQPAGRLSR